MKTKTLYFSHDFNASSDDKIVYLCEKFGGIAYGFYWHVIEKLHTELEHKIFIKQYSLGSIAKFLKIDIPLLKEIIDYSINECELFESDGDSFWSERVFKNVEKYDLYIEAKKRGGEASAKARAEKAEQERLANELAQVNTCSTDVQHNSTGVQHNSTGVQHNLTDVNTAQQTKLNKSKLNKNKLNNILQFTFSNCIEELRNSDNFKIECERILKINRNKFDEYLNNFEFHNKPTDELELFEFDKVRTHFSYWLKNNKDKLPQSNNNNTTNKPIIIPPKQ